jgi:maleylacetate reductase
MNLTFDHVTLGQRVLFGAGAAAANIVSAVESLGSRRLLMITSSSAGLFGDDIGSELRVVARITKVVQHVPVHQADEATEVAIARKADGILCIGGGSATGLAKIVALRTGLPIIAVPTTFAGSEATDVWGLTEAARKTTGSDPRVLPKVVVYDAVLSADLPIGAAVASGMNAMAHAVDGFWAPRADPINAALGTEALRALSSGLQGLVADPGDLQAREQTQYAAYLSAVAFASAGSGMHHKICHVLGGAYGLPHAEMHAVLLPYVTAFNISSAPKAAARIADGLGTTDAGLGLWDLARALGAPQSLKSIGFQERDLLMAAQLSLKVIPPSNPRPVSLAGLESLLRSAWAGEPVK